jgi:putative nucleotidyltransferase with HDIG domain
VIERLVGDLFDVLTDLFSDRPSLTVFIHEETFFLNNAMLLEESVRLSPLLNELKKRAVRSLTISRGVEPREVRCLIAMLGTPADDIQRCGGAAAYLSQNDVRHIVVGSGQATPIAPGAAVPVDPRDAYRAGLHVIDELHYQASTSGSLDLHKAHLIVNSFIDIVTHHRAGLMGIATIKEYDQDTCHHSVNVCILSLFMASRLQFERAVTSILGLASLLHDIGKVRIPRHILNKTGKFSEEEWRIMQRHTSYGAQLLNQLTGPARLAMVVAFEHHANYDLSGYPTIATKEHPHLLARVVQIVDSFDAATSSRRIYRRPLPPDGAMRFILNGAGTIYDPALAGAFVHELGVYPAGTLVVLDDGALAVVRRPGGHDAARPTVGIIDSRAATPVVADELNLEEHGERRILRSTDPRDLGMDVATYMALANQGLGDAGTG